MSDNAAVEIAEKAFKKKFDLLNISEEPTSSNSEDKTRVNMNSFAYLAKIFLEAQIQKKEVIVSGLKGKVKWYSVRRRHGFIARDDGGDDVFVHQTAISKSAINKFYLRTLGQDEEVVFDLVEGKKGPVASNVCGPYGDNVLGSSEFKMGRRGTIRNRNIKGKVEIIESSRRNVIDEPEESTNTD